MKYVGNLFNVRWTGRSQPDYLTSFAFSILEPLTVPPPLGLKNISGDPGRKSQMCSWEDQDKPWARPLLGGAGVVSHRDLLHRCRPRSYTPTAWRSEHTPPGPALLLPGSHHSPIPFWGWVSGKSSLFPTAQPFPAFWELRTAPSSYSGLVLGYQPPGWKSEWSPPLVPFPPLPIRWGSSTISLRPPALHHWGLRTAPGSAHQRSEEGRMVDPRLVRLFSPTRASEQAPSPPGPPRGVSSQNLHSGPPHPWGQNSSSSPPSASGPSPPRGPRAPRATGSTRYLRRRSGSVRLRGAGSSRSSGCRKLRSSTSAASCQLAKQAGPRRRISSAASSVSTSPLGFSTTTAGSRSTENWRPRSLHGGQISDPKLGNTISLLPVLTERLPCTLPLLGSGDSWGPGQAKPHWPLRCASDIPDLLPLQGLCTGHDLCLEHSPQTSAG